MAKKKEPTAKIRDKAILAAIRKKFGSHAALSISEERAAAAQITEYISTGVDVLDHYVIGRGGLPCGRMSEVFSEEGAGKTALSLSAIAACQAEGGIAVLMDTEYSFDEERAETFGVDLDALIIEQPQNLEELFEMIKATLAAHDPDDGKLLIVWDSIAATKTKVGSIAEAGSARVGEVPLLMSQELPKLLKPLHASRAHLLMTNQIRSKIGVMFGSNITTPGGHATHFYASVRLQFFGGKKIENKKKEHTGKVVTIMAVKNRLSAPWRKARVRFDYASGYNNVYSTVAHAKTQGVIKPREDGFSGKSYQGAKAYLEACKRLGWTARLPEKIVEVEEEDDGTDSDESDEDD